MSRASETNARYTMAFGVDHTPMGCFFQVYEKDHETEEGGPGVQADELYGVKIEDKGILERNPTLAKRIGEINDLAMLRDEAVIAGVGKALGLDVERKVYELWD